MSNRDACYLFPGSHMAVEALSVAPPGVRRGIQLEADDLEGAQKFRCEDGMFFFKCLLCGKEFASKADMRRHIRIHTGEKPFKCQYCDFRVNHKSNLKKHINLRHVELIAHKHDKERL